MMQQLHNKSLIPKSYKVSKQLKWNVVVTICNLKHGHHEKFACIVYYSSMYTTYYYIILIPKCTSIVWY